MPAASSPSQGLHEASLPTAADFHALSPCALADVFILGHVMDARLYALWTPVPRVAGPAFDAGPRRRKFRRSVPEDPPVTPIRSAFRPVQPLAAVSLITLLLLSGCREGAASTQADPRAASTATPSWPALKGTVHLAQDPQSEAPGQHQDADAAGLTLAVVVDITSESTPIPEPPTLPEGILAQTKVAQDLSWRLALPPVPEGYLTPLITMDNMGEACTVKEHRVSPAGVGIAPAYLALQTAHTEPDPYLDEAPTGFERLYAPGRPLNVEEQANAMLLHGLNGNHRTYELRYVERDVEAHLLADCRLGGARLSRIDQQLRLKQGWNLIEYEVLEFFENQTLVERQAARIAPPGTPLPLRSRH